MEIAKAHCPTCGALVTKFELDHWKDDEDHPLDWRLYGCRQCDDVADARRVIVPTFNFDRPDALAHKLCYVNEESMQCFFCPPDVDVKDVYGDGWTLSPYQYNASIPHEEFNCLSVCVWGDVSSPPYSPFRSAKQINAGEYPWLTIGEYWLPEPIYLFAGVTLEQVWDAVLRRNGIVFVPAVLIGGKHE